MYIHQSRNNECNQSDSSIPLFYNQNSINLCQSNNLPSYLVNSNQSTIVNFATDSSNRCNILKNLDPINIPPLFTSAKASLYTRYTPKDWSNFECNQFTNANEILNDSQKLTKESDLLACEIDKQVCANQWKSTNEILIIKQEISFWKNEIEKLRQKLNDTINELEVKRQQIEYFLNRTASRLKIVQENLYEREKRQTIDLIHDNVDRELIKLIDILIDAKNSIDNGMIERINKQIHLNRERLCQLDIEANNKSYALILENATLYLTNTLPCFSNCKNSFSGGITYLNWLKHTKTVVEQTYCEIQTSNELIHSVKNFFHIEQNIFDQWQTVGIVLEQRIHEIQCVRNRLQDQFNEINEKILNTEKMIEFLKKTIQDKEVFINIIQCRISFLSMKPVLENINDREYSKLSEEFNNLNYSIDNLQKKLFEEEYILQHLFRLKATIEEDLAIKNNSLFIDEQKVIGLRRTFPFTS
ncbi:unnamed protein product [Rotaria sp. Silwood1]|nr:unnamed protein product [Rotaria sp. Silwood1]CAF3336575.1 unnamed protein product [Rotaria sp. Silwood1]CAF4521307.1 unnamed protein product [Rotaria sp. Silwood1]